jgi:hypothetical protein
MSRSTDELQARLIEHCEEMIEHVKALRDYATTPDNIWLARSELTHLNQLTSEAEQLLSALKQAD